MINMARNITMRANKTKIIKKYEKLSQIVIVLLLLITISNNEAKADVYKGASNLWKSLGGKSVSTGANIYKSQSGGHVTLGNVYLANTQKHRPIISVNHPEISLKNPCVGSSVINLGGLAHISGEELKNKVQTIIQSAGLGFVYLGLSAVSPVLSETLQEVFSKIQEMGGFLNDECNTGMMAATFVKDKAAEHFSSKQNQIVEHEMSGKGDKADLSSVYKKMPKGSGDKIEEIAKKNPEKRLVNVNLAWDSLKKLGADEKTKKLMMTLSGTIIVHENKNNKDGEPIVQYIAPKIINPELLEALLKGNSEMKILGCSDNEQCLKIKEDSQKLGAEDGFEYKVAQYFKKFGDALADDKDLDSQSQNFLAKASLPVFMMYDGLWLKTDGHPEAEAGILIEITAWNILYHYLTELINESIEAANNYTIGAATELNRYKEGLIKTREMLNNYQIRDNNRHKLQVMLVQRAEYMNKAMNEETTKLIGGL
ncbi:conjugal transfer protein TraH (plasmid) [Candidatus Bandiella numerosa]|uniref:conjugal transfer protein TraH n=1 Tax=Candidatus Bandiella numerosa TaxID=2570586 RepID=UPI00249DF427|nr:conjugal transfer protein TraH [Candidatus Bandiella numerosa]WHA05669.1 conjugal transfer protein TraH [Candidatus Bandiella numerosa]